MQKVINKIMAAAIKFVSFAKRSSPEEVLANMVLSQDLGQDEYNRLADLLLA